MGRSRPSGSDSSRRAAYLRGRRFRQVVNTDASMRALMLLHRWLGVAFCLLFAMWFASGIVMHFVPFPALTEAERFAGLAPLDLARVQHNPAEAITASRIADVKRVRLMQRSD